MKAFLKNYRQSPRKVRLVAGLVKGKPVPQALAELDFLVKRAGFPIKKLLLSAVSNAKNQGQEAENLYIKSLTVDKGIVMKRMLPAAMGSAHRMNKRTSHIEIVLGEIAEKAGKKATSNSLSAGKKDKKKEEPKKKEEKIEKKTKSEKVVAEKITKRKSKKLAPKN